MNNKQVIPQVGQVWINKDSLEDCIIKTIQKGEVFFECNYYCDIVEISELFTFKPANDLEWLAVNAPLYNLSSADININVARRGESATFGDYRYLQDSHPVRQVIDKRNELFGETEVKPKNNNDELGYDGAKGNDAMNNILNDAQTKILHAISMIKNDNSDEAAESLSGCDNLISMAIDGTCVDVVKPKMKVSYEVCKFNHAWEAVKAYQEDAYILFCDVHGHYENLPHAIAAHKAFNGDNLYRKIETPVTWQEAVTDFMESDSKCEDTTKSYSVNTSHMNDCDFILLCHLVASMTDKPE